MLSQRRRLTPFFPNSPKRCKSVITPSIGSKSILKSPVWMTLPAGVEIQSAIEPAIECETLINSIANGPILRTFFGLTEIALYCTLGYSFILFSTSASVNLLPYIGALIWSSTKGSPPIWSSCPCVKIKALTLSLFASKYDMSGTTTSIPGISSPGKVSPASTTMISSPYSKAVIFLPISPTPPKNVILSLFILSPFVYKLK